MVRRTGPHTPAGCARSGPTPIPSEAYSPKGSSRTYESGQESGLDVIQRLLTAAWSGCTKYRPKWTSFATMSKKWGQTLRPPIHLPLDSTCQ